jgi:hypothetical protein
MFPKGKDLARLMPAVALFVNNYVTLSPDNANGFLFVKKPGVPVGNFFRVKGATGRQISKLRRLHKLPKNVVGKRARGGWTEFSVPLGPDHVSLEATTVYNGYRSQIYEIVWDLTTNQEEGFDISGLYINGKACDYEGLKWNRVGRKDVVVVVADGGEEDFGSLRQFNNMPAMEVHKEILKGPLVHKDMAGLTPLDVWITNIPKDWKITLLELVVCPHCGVGDCDNHHIRHSDKIFIRQGWNGVSRTPLKYCVQSPLFIGDATDKLGPFAWTLLGIKPNVEEWPTEVVRVVINNEDVTRMICGYMIEPASLIQVCLVDPRLKLRSE